MIFKEFLYVINVIKIVYASLTGAEAFRVHFMKKDLNLTKLNFFIFQFFMFYMSTTKKDYSFYLNHKFEKCLENIAFLDAQKTHFKSGFK